jgi:hypothetical protein
LIEQNKGTIQVVTFFKYPIETTAGILPTIKVNLRNNPNENFSDFRKSIEASFSGIKKVFPDFKYTSAPTETVIDGKKCVTATCMYTLTGNYGKGKVKIIVCHSSKKPILSNNIYGYRRRQQFRVIQ